ncbi:hypothetical protein RM553_10785, partial [Zunongwangia sp. F363]
IFLLGFSVMLFLLFFWVKDFEPYLSIFPLYLGIFIVTLQLPDWRFLNPIKVILLLPGYIIISLKPILKSFGLIFLGFIAPSSLILFFLIFQGPEIIFGYDLTASLKIYIYLTFQFIFVMIYGERLIFLWNKKLSLDKPIEVRKAQFDLVLSIMNRERFRFLIYLSYFVFLIITASTTLNNTPLLEGYGLNTAVLQSFVTFLAFDRLLLNKNLFVFEPRLFIQKFSKVFKAMFN